ncbi:MAG: prepilin-type N-terminal cleavage/methylation domain-containing protein, partial [Planctomycetota bacterium]
MNAPGHVLLLRSSTRAEKRRPRGFTLVEILTALFVMVIGISGTLAIIMRSSQMGTSASDRNNASILLPEAIDEIKRSLIATVNDGVTADHVGEYMDTVNLTGSGNPFYSVRLGNTPISSLVYPKALTQQDTLGHDMSLVYWPFSPNGSRVMGQRLTTKAGVTLGNTGTLGG